MPIKKTASKTTRRVTKAAGEAGPTTGPSRKRPAAPARGVEEAEESADSDAGGPSVRTLAQGMRSIGNAAAAATLSLVGSSGVAQVLRNAGKAVIAQQLKRAVNGRGEERPGWAKTGAALRRHREQAGLTLEQLAAAVNLKDPELLAVAEEGLAGLPIEIILRVARVIGRNDPVLMAMKLTRGAYPQGWEKLESLGIGKLIAHSKREREFLSILRSHDEIHPLDDEEFAQLLAFVKSSLDLALTFRAKLAEAKTDEFENSSD